MAAAAAAADETGALLVATKVRGAARGEAACGREEGRGRAVAGGDERERNRISRSFARVREREGKFLGAW